MVRSGKNIAFVIGVMCIVLGACSSSFIPIYKYKDLTCYNKQFISGKIRTDGYYSTNYNDTLFLDVICFYEDGFFLGIMNDYTDDTTMTNFLRKFSKEKTKRLTKSKGWGVYRVENDTLTMQGFSSGKPPRIYALTFEHFAVIQSKAIINNEKFIDYEYFFRRKSEKVNDIYQFHPCIDCKPDSTNWLRTNKRLNKLYPKIE